MLHQSSGAICVSAIGTCQRVGCTTARQFRPPRQTPLSHLCGASFGTVRSFQNWDLGGTHRKTQEPFCGPKVWAQFRDPVLTTTEQKFGPTGAPWSACRASSAAPGRAGPRSALFSAVASALPTSVHGLHALLPVAATRLTGGPPCAAVPQHRAPCW